jgi:glyoxylase-like metal-dependent hydrolase (beta-lactamase superfamily II)
MIKSRNRRRFMASAAAGALASACWSPLLQAQRNAGRIGAVPLRGNLTLLSGAGANVVAATGPEGVVLVDGGLPEQAAAVGEFIAALTDAPRIETLFNTNWRPEHTGLNANVIASGGRVLAHVNTRLWMANDFTVPWEERVHAPQPKSELPTDTFYKDGRLALGEQRIDYAYLPQAHTDGDIYVFFPAENVLVVSDLLAVGSYPVVDWVTGGWIGGLADATAALLELTDTETLIVPAQGPVAGQAELARQLEFCRAMKDTVGGLIKNGKSLEEVIAAAPTKPYDSGWSGDPELFLALTYKGLWGHIRELGGVL